MKKFFVMTLLIAFMLSIFTFTGVTAAVITSFRAGRRLPQPPCRRC